MSQMKNLFTICHINLQLHIKNSPTIEKKMLLLSFMLYRNWISICMTAFVIRIDHKPLKYIMDSPVLNKKIQHWTKTFIVTTVRLNTQRVRRMSVVTCCHACHIAHQVVMMTMNLVALISQIKRLKSV